MFTLGYYINSFALSPTHTVSILLSKNGTRDIFISKMLSMRMIFAEEFVFCGYVDNFCNERQIPHRVYGSLSFLLTVFLQITKYHEGNQSRKQSFSDILPEQITTLLKAEGSLSDIVLIARQLKQLQVLNIRSVSKTFCWYTHSDNQSFLSIYDPIGYITVTVFNCECT